MKKNTFIGLLLFLSLCACSSTSEESGEVDSSSYSSSEYENGSSHYSDEAVSEESSIDYESSPSHYAGGIASEDSYEDTDACMFENGTYTATVDYHNPRTGHYATYTLDVEVENCQVIQINFPNGGYLDADHISYAALDENGNATVDGEDGKTYEVKIYN